MRRRGSRVQPCMADDRWRTKRTQDIEIRARVAVRTQRPPPFIAALLLLSSAVALAGRQDVGRAAVARPDMLPSRLQQAV